LSDSIHLWLIHFYCFNHPYAIHRDSFRSLFDIIQQFQFFFIHSIQSHTFDHSFLFLIIDWMID